MIVRFYWENPAGLSGLRLADQIARIAFARIEKNFLGELDWETFWRHLENHTCKCRCI
jgi:hypothetical protein